MPSPDRRIAAVVVTYNRLDLLQRLLEALDAFGDVDEVLVVDNASTDGTGEWLAGLDGERVHGRTLATNTGGAGGFHDGCLDLLLAHDGDLDFWGPVVVDRADPERLVFPIRLPGGARVVHAMTDVRRAAEGGLIRGIVIPFNGVLVTRELVEGIGLPRAEFFIWGDDHEYRLRAERAGARIATVVDARVQHPSVGALGTPMAFGRTTYNDTPSDLKHYCMARNNLLNLREYGGRLHAAAFVAKTLWFYTFTRRDPARIRLSLDAWRAAWRGDFSGHRKFLA